MYFVYILQSLKDNDLYIGYSSDLKRRLSEHHDGRSSATKHRRPLRLIYYEAYPDMKDAKGREMFLKSGGGHRFIKKQLANFFKITGT